MWEKGEGHEQDVTAGQPDLTQDFSGTGGTCLETMTTEAASAWGTMMAMANGDDNYDDGDYEDAMCRFMDTASFQEFEKLRDSDPLNQDRVGEVAAMAEKEEDKMWKTLKDKNFVFLVAGNKGNPMAGRWVRAVRNAPQLKKDDAAVGKGHAAQQAFRKTWANASFDKYEMEKTQTETRVHR